MFRHFLCIGLVLLLDLLLGVSCFLVFFKMAGFLPLNLNCCKILNMKIKDFYVSQVKWMWHTGQFILIIHLRMSCSFFIHNISYANHEILFHLF